MRRAEWVRRTFEDGFTAAGYTHRRHTKSVVEYASHRSGHLVYALAWRDALLLVLDPRVPVDGTPVGQAVEDARQLRRLDFVHDSNMRHFPRRQNYGVRPIQHGRAVILDSAPSLTRLLDELDGLPAPPR